MMDISKFIKISENKQVDDYEKHMFDNIIKDKSLMSFLYSLGIKSHDIIKDNVVRITDYKEEKEYCDKCPGFSLCNKNRPHYVSSLSYNGKFLDPKVVPCHLKEEDFKLDKRYIVRDFPREWRTLSQTDIRPLTAPKKGIIKRLARANIDSRNWIYIYGNHRSGKSYIAAFISCLPIFDTVAYLDYPKRARELSDLSFNNPVDFNRIIEDYKNVDLLVLDNFGDEYKNDFIRDSITLQILNARASKGLTTIFTSTFAYQEIASMYSVSSSGRARAKQIENLLEDYAEEPFDISTNIYK